MAESLAQFFLTKFSAHSAELAYGQRRGYRMERFTYGQVMEMALGFCSELEARGIGKGDRVMLSGENCAEWVAAFFGCALCGAIVVPMDDGASPDFAVRVANQVEAKLWVCSLKHATERAAGSIPVVTLQEIKTPALSQKTRQGRGTQREAEAAVGPGDTLQIVFTSGTTAEPKGVMITHGNVLANIAPFEKEMRQYLKYERWAHPVRFLNLLPLSHVFGQFL
jgi:long-chain acyl-CoA synthetase